MKKVVKHIKSMTAVILAAGLLASTPIVSTALAVKPTTMPVSGWVDDTPDSPAYDTDVDSDEPYYPDKETEYFTSGLFTYYVANGGAYITDFKGKNSVSEVTIPSTIDGISVIGLGEMLFRHCSSLTSVTISEGVKSIGWQCFYNCRNLSSITLPDSLEAIGEQAFCSCPITEITIPKNVARIDNNFQDIGALAYINVAQGNTSFSSIDGVLYNGDGTKLITYPRRMTLEEYTVADSTKEIGENAFNKHCYYYDDYYYTTGISTLKKITLPQGLEKISDSAFSYCENLRSINLPDSIANIGDSAFSYCYDLRSINLPDSVVNIGCSAFYCCSKLVIGSTMPASLQSVGNYAFYGCKMLMGVDFSDGLNSIGSSSFEGCINLKYANIPDSTASISDRAFSGCSTLAYAIIRGGDTYVGDSAFSACPKVTIYGESGSNAQSYAQANSVAFKPMSQLSANWRSEAESLPDFYDTMSPIAECSFTDYSTGETVSRNVQMTFAYNDNNQPIYYADLNFDQGLTQYDVAVNVDGSRWKKTFATGCYYATERLVFHPDTLASEWVEISKDREAYLENDAPTVSLYNESTGEFISGPYKMEYFDNGDDNFKASIPISRSIAGTTISVRVDLHTTLTNNEQAYDCHTYNYGYGGTIYCYFYDVYIVTSNGEPALRGWFNVDYSENYTPPQDSDVTTGSDEPLDTDTYTDVDTDSDWSTDIDALAPVAVISYHDYETGEDAAKSYEMEFAANDDNGSAYYFADVTVEQGLTLFNYKVEVDGKTCRGGSRSVGDLFLNGRVVFFPESRKVTFEEIGDDREAFYAQYRPTVSVYNNDTGELISDSHEMKYQGEGSRAFVCDIPVKKTDTAVNYRVELNTKSALGKPTKYVYSDGKAGTLKCSYANPYYSYSVGYVYPDGTGDALSDLYYDFYVTFEELPDTGYTGDDPEFDSNAKMGDVTGDGLINSADALLIFRASLGSEELTREQTILADVDRDDNVTSTDAVSVLRYSVKKTYLGSIGVKPQ